MMHGNDGRRLRERVAADLAVATRVRDMPRVRVLRALLGAIDNAEAVVTPQSRPPGGVLGAAFGSSEVPRRVLGAADVRRLLEAEVAERRGAAAVYRGRGRDAEAERLEAEIAVISAYTETGPSPE